MTVKSIIRLSTKPDGFGETQDELDLNMFASALPTQHSYEYYTDDDLGLYIGVWDTDDMIEAAGPYACDEFMWLIEGQAHIKNNRTGAVETASAGEAFTIPRGYDCQWHQTGYLRKFYVIWENPEEPIPEPPSHEGIILPRTNAPLTAMKNTSHFLGTTGATARENISYTDTTGRFFSGTWQSNAIDTQQRPSPDNVFACIQAGSIQFEDEAGTEHVFTTGDAFFIPQGTKYSVCVQDTVTVFFAIVQSETK